MSRKDNLLKFPIFTTQDLDVDSQSIISNIQWLDNIGIQVNITGTPEGSFVPQISIDYARDLNGNVTDPGNWVDLAGAAISVSAGSPDTLYFDLNQLSASWIRLAYTNTFIESVDIATVADSSGSLNNKYFLINGSDGDNWYVWFNINSAGTDPALPGRTAIPVAGATNASANTLATAIRAALGACTSLDNIGGATNHVLADQSEPGSGSIVDGAAPTGFTFTYDATDGSASAFISAKML